MKEIHAPKINYCIVVASAEGVVQRWLDLYGKSSFHASTTEKLKALVDPTIEQLNAILPRSWTTPQCVVCETYVQEGVRVGYEEGSCICEPCLEKLTAVLREHRQGGTT